MITENGSLKIRNAQLQAENSLLKQRIIFLEQVVLNSNKISNQMKEEMKSPFRYSDEPLLPLTQPVRKQENSELNLGEFNFDPKYCPNIVTNNGQQFVYQSKSQSNPRSHFVFFIVMTVLLLFFGFGSGGTEITISPPGFEGTGDVKPQSVDDPNFIATNSNWE